VANKKLTKHTCSCPLIDVVSEGAKQALLYSFSGNGGGFSDNITALFLFNKAEIAKRALLCSLSGNGGGFSDNITALLIFNKAEIAKRPKVKCHMCYLMNR
jgi:hypothetical protein